SSSRRPAGTPTSAATPPKPVWDRLRRQVGGESRGPLRDLRRAGPALAGGILAGRTERWGGRQAPRGLMLRRRSQGPAAGAAGFSLSRLPGGQARRPDLEAGSAGPPATRLGGM